MATCVRCKREIDATLKYCPYCGAKQNMFIDVNQVVNKSLIDGKFDASRDIKKAPRVEIIIDDSEAATPVFPQTKDGKEVGRIEDLPEPDIKEADISEYNDNIEIVMPEDVSERLNKVTAEEQVEEETEEKKDIFKEISESDDEAYSRKLNVFNTIFNLVINIACLFLVGFVYFYQTSNMLIIDILKDIKHNMISIVHLGYEQYAAALGVASLAIALIFLIVYIVKIIIGIKKPYKQVGHHYYFGLSMAFIISTLFFNTAIGKFKIIPFNYFYRIHSYLIMGLTLISFIINWICRCADSYTLSFRWGFNRYYLENKEKLPKLSGMVSSISRRKMAYLLIIAFMLFGIYTDYLLSIFVTSYKQSSIANYNFDLSMYSNYFSRYVQYKAQFDGFFNIFKIIAPTMEIFYINGYGTYTVMLFVLVILTNICIIAREYMARRKEKVISKVSSIIYIVSLITFLVLMFRSGFTLLSILDGAGVNENVDPLIRNSTIAQTGTYLLCFIIMILDRTLNKNITRKQMSIYKEN